MLDDYLKKLESLITPRSFSLKTFNEKKNPAAKLKEILKLPPTDNSILKTDQSTSYPSNPTNPNNPNQNQKQILTTESSIDKIKLYEKMLDDKSLFLNSNNYDSNIRITNDNLNISKQRIITNDLSQQSQTILPDNYREIIHSLKLKNMNLRHDIMMQKEKIDEFEREGLNKDRIIQQLEKQKVNDSKYLLKLEGYLAHEQNNNSTYEMIPNLNTGVTLGGNGKNHSILNMKKMNSENSNRSNTILTKHDSSVFSNTTLKKTLSTSSKLVAGAGASASKHSINKSKIPSNKSFNVNANNKSNITTTTNLNEESMYSELNLTFSNQKGIQEYVMKLVQDNYKLKDFQKKVLDISKNYKVFNENIYESIKIMKDCLTEFADFDFYKNSCMKSEFTQNVINNLLKSYEPMMENINEILETKQKEYMLLIEAKDQELNVYSEELIKLKKTLEINKKDRFRDIRIISDLERINCFFSDKLEFYEGKPKKEVRLEKDLTVDKKMSPVKDSMKRFITNFEKVFDLEDNKNIGFMDKLNRTLNN